MAARTLPLAEYVPEAAETAVRSYLLFLDDPAKLRDDAEIQALAASVVEADDPIEKLKALAALEKASTVDEEALRDEFVTYACAWAQDNGISVRAFREFGVPDSVLSAAGFSVSRPRRRRSRTAVTVGDVKEALASFVDPFTLAEVMAKAGGSPMTVRKAVEELIAEGRIERIGSVPGHVGRGRAPIAYRTVAAHGHEQGSES